MAREFCYKCQRPQSSCLCSHFHSIHTKTHIVILIHPMERQKIKNGTGRMTHFQLENSSLIYGIDFTQDKRVNQLLQKYRCSLLYPGETSLNLSAIEDHSSLKSQDIDIPECIFILDATWPLAKKMLRLSKNLQDLPKLSFSSKIKSEFVIKQQPHELCLSTVESTKVLLDELIRVGIENKSLQTNSFLKPFREMLRYQIDCINNPSNNTHQHIRTKRISKKNNYKKKGARKLFFES